ncbi:XRE family transcriptional regulator [Halobacillus andaensis]|uniref:XRE family transcriptional regulator n=1 Tax=Halobacillus andaensis TaxID=1176239 RepID=A0A917AZG8_HALAA|nr:helix-turn-helix domain-containing protein [Halobacillus andaensis]MBP2003427.1 cytoskeletal protein RodZ [Halobacillus andaensis]GGF10522.1 XRE family transcriptional regulator [Halobacillus andaensis]
MEIGSRLREAREEKGLTLEEVQRTTKIQKRYLQAIEKNEFDVLPGKFYTRAFIREYASAVGLDPEQVMEEHKSELPSNEEEQVITYSRVQKSKSENRPAMGGGMSKAFPTILTVVLIVGLLFVAWYFILQVSNPNDSANEEESSEDQVNVSNPPDDEDESDDQDSAGNESDSGEGEGDEEESNESGSEEEANSEDDAEEEEEEEMDVSLEETGSGGFPEHIYEISNAGERELTIEFDGETYVEVNAPKGGESLADARNYSADDEDLNVDLSEFDEVYIKTGSVPGITVKVNDEEIEFPADNLTQKLLIRFE